MTDSPKPVRVWPPSPYRLADDTRCPSCFEPASQSVCVHCGLGLDDPRTDRVVELGRQMLALEVVRQSTMDSIRLTQLEAAAAASARQAAAAAEASARHAMAAQVASPPEQVPAPAGGGGADPRCRGHVGAHRHAGP